MKLNRILFPLALALPALSAGAQDIPVLEVSKGLNPQAPAIHYAGATRIAGAKAKAKAADSQLFTADVTDAMATVWSDNFDKGISGWTFSPSSYVTWAGKATSGAKAFSAIDPADKSSLYVEGPYQSYRRETSYATSGAFEVPYSAKLSLWVGFSRNYDDCCRLIISVSDDDFATSTDIWNSKDADGEKPWAWHQVNADLADWAGKTVKLRLTYAWGSGDETFKTGGYLGDFAIDDIKVSGVKTISHVDLTTGEKLRLVCLDPQASNLKWSFPGAVPAESTESNPTIYYTADGTYDVTLTATVGGEEVTSTVAGFATVTGTEPVARILPPATFREASSHNYLVPPLTPVTFASASDGFPTDHIWMFAGTTDGDGEAIEEIRGDLATVSYMYQHSWLVGLTVANDHGASNDIVNVCAEFEGGITNTLTTDYATTFDMSDWGVFPGTNTHKITRFAEHFSAPAVPVVMTGAYLYFVDAPATVTITDNTMITVSVYTCENGVPGERLDFGLWDVVNLTGPSAEGSLQGTFFEFTEMPVIDDEFFIVVDGLPEYRVAGKDSEDDPGCRISFAMANLRAGSNTAYMEIDGKWQSAEGYFEAGKGTSYFITPYVAHSVMTSLPVGNDEIIVPKEGGDIEHQIFSYMGYQTPVISDADWCEVINEPNGMTVDTLTIRCQPNDSKTDRTARLTLSDGVGSLVLTLRQAATSGVTTISADQALKGDAQYFNLQGIRVDQPTSGRVYIRLNSDGSASKVTF